MADSGLPSLLMQAARSAAEADGVAPPPEVEDGDKKDLDLMSSAGASALEKARAAIAAAQGGGAAESSGRKSANAGMSGAGGGGGGKKKGPPLRRGKWTAEEEAYANRLIQEFKAGLLPLTDGTTLRTFLSKLLNCDPMRISKKFVGNNCIGKQVFRRRTADLNRLTPEQIQQSRAELSELERRFLERVAQTNRVKSSGVGAPAGSSAPVTEGAINPVGKPKDDTVDTSPPSPPWLQPPVGYKQGNGAAMAAGGAENRAAAAGRALLEGLGADTIKSLLERKPSSSGLSSHGSAGLLAMAELQRQASRQNLLQNALANRSSANSLLDAATGGNSSGLSGPAMAQIVRNASAARLAGLTAAGNSVNNLMLKTGLSRDQLTQLARDQGLSSASLGNMIDRQNSFDALMSLDFQSLQSIDNLANLIQTGGALQGRAPESGMKNWSADSALGNSQSDLAAAVAAAAASSANNLANLKRLASNGGLEIDSLLRTLSGGNLGQRNAQNNGGGGSSSNLTNLLQSLQGNLNGLGGSGNSTNSLLGSGDAASALSLANLLRAESSTGLTALRMQDGLSQRNSSVDDFLSLVASGDIPHQDPTLLNVPLMQQQNSNQNDNNATAQLLAHQQLLARVGSNSILANALASRSLGNLMGSGSASLLNPSSSSAALNLAQQRAAEDSRTLNNLMNSGSASLLNPSSSSAALAIAQQQAREGAESPTSTLKRKLRELEQSLMNGQGNPKR